MRPRVAWLRFSKRRTATRMSDLTGSCDTGSDDGKSTHDERSRDSLDEICSHQSGCATSAGALPLPPTPPRDGTLWPKSHALGPRSSLGS